MTREDIEKANGIIQKITELEDLERFLQITGINALSITLCNRNSDSRFNELPNFIIDLIEPTLTEAIASELAKAKKQLEDL